MTNTICVVGNLVRDSEIKTFGEEKFLSFSIADNVFQGRDREDHVNFIDVLYYTKNPEKFIDSFKKGSQATVMGEMKARVQEKNGKHYLNIGIRANKLPFPPKEKKGNGVETQKELDDEIPF